MEKVLISGGSGMIGREIAKKLTDHGYEVALLSRKVNKQILYKQYTWDVSSNQPDSEALDKLSYIVHLAGANISDKRWTNAQKLEIEQSRVLSTEMLFAACQANRINLKAFISTSAIGYYGSFTSDKILEETDGPGNDFLAGVCVKWENAVNLFANTGVRTVILRTGVVLSSYGGAYIKIANLARKRMTSPVGNGNQYVPWIHVNDISNMFIKAIMDERMNGIYNGVAPEHITNEEFTRLIAKSLQKPVVLPNVPAFVLRAALGEMSDILLKGSRVSSQRIINSGFEFEFPGIRKALQDLSEN